MKLAGLILMLVAFEEIAVSIVTDGKQGFDEILDVNIHHKQSSPAVFSVKSVEITDDFAIPKTVNVSFNDNDQDLEETIEEISIHEDILNSTQSETENEDNSTIADGRRLSLPDHLRSGTSFVSSNYGNSARRNNPYWLGNMEKWRFLQGYGYDPKYQWGDWDLWLDDTLHGHAMCRSTNWPAWCSFYNYKRQTPFPGIFSDQKLTYLFMERQVPVVRKWLCSSSTLFSKPVPGCYCDKECLLFGDCCVDVFTVIPGLQNITESATYIVTNPEDLYERISNPSLEASYLVLYHAYGSCHRMNINNSMMTVTLIDKCPERRPEGVDPGYSEKCSNSSKDILSMIPVTLSFSKRWQVVFSSVFCAFCHGLEEEDIVLWKAYAKCPAGLNLTSFQDAEMLLWNYCTTIYTPPLPSGKLRRCFLETELKSTCTSSESSIDNKACPAYIAPVWFGGYAYRNIHCAYCRKHFASKYDFVRPIADVHMANSPQHAISAGAHPTESFGKPGRLPGFLPTPRPAPSMKVLFDFSFQAGLIFSEDGSSNEGTAKLCRGETVYDLVSESCKPVICPLELKWKHGKCVHETLVFNDVELLLPESSDEQFGLVLSIALQVQNKSIVNETMIVRSYIFKLTELLGNFADKTSEENISITVKELPDLSVGTYKTSTDDNVTLTFHLSIIPGRDLELSEVIEAVKRFTRLITRIGMERFHDVLNTSLSNRHLDQNFECPGGRHLKRLDNMTFININDTLYFIDKEINVATPAVNTIFSFSFLPGSTPPAVHDVIVCSSLLCPQIKLSDKEYTLENETLQILTSGQHLSRDDYDIRNNSVYICISARGHVRQDLPDTYFYIPAAQLLQIATYSLSIIALTLTILIYIRYVSVRTLHGKTLVSLSASLIGAQLTGLLPIASGSVWCKMLAIIMHFSWLSAFGWMSMISYNMLTTFFCKQTTVTNTHIDRKRYFVYSLVGWLAPAVIVVLCIVLDNVAVPEIIQIGYGQGAGVCFISGKGIFIFFSVPINCSVVFNMFSFFLTVFGISRKHKVVPGSRRSKDRWFFLIYMKLAIVMGITWLIAILASVTHQAVLWYIHFILNGLQGVFVFISFALRATIWRKIKIKKVIKHHNLKGTAFYSISGNSSNLS